ncbi:MAG: chromosome partitioning protein ParB [Pelagibacterales bacterium]|nr:chromosome partitioning protein ParB [Pelagibacterales bacterium]
MITKKRLKTGLNILLGDDKKSSANINTNIQKTKIDLSLIEVNSKQPRKTFDDDKLLELSNSIKNIGQIVPIIVRESPKNKNKYIVVAGERRWRASKLAGLKTIDVVFSDKNEKLSSLASVIENVQREDLNSMEEAEAYNSLINEHNLTHEEISKFTGKSRSYISNFIRIVGLPDDVKQFLIERKITFGHARALLSAKHITKMANIVIKHQLNVRQTEDLIKEEQKEISKKDINNENINEKDPNISDYEKYLSLKLGYEVEIKDKKGKGVLSVKYKTLDQLENIISIFNKE